MNNNKELIEKLEQLERVVNYYRDVYLSRRLYYEKNPGVKTLLTGLKYDYKNYCEKNDELEAELKKNKDQMVKICKCMANDFTNYFLCSENRFSPHHYAEKIRAIFKKTQN